MDQRGKVTNPACGQLNRGFFFSSPSALENLVSRDRFAVSLLILHTQAESGLDAGTPK